MLNDLRASIRSVIESGTSVVVDRYFYSGCVYSAAKENPSLSLSWARHAEVGLPRPDVCIFLDISAEDAAKRGGFGEEKYETAAMQARVRSLFNEMRSGVDGADIVSVDAGASVDEVEKQVLKTVLEVCRRVDESGDALEAVSES